MTRERTIPFRSLALLACAACETTSGEPRPAPARAVQPACAEPDGPDASPVPAETAGDPCTSDADCPWDGATCLAWPGGYCVLPCAPDGTCDEGTCDVLPGTEERRCLRACERDRECRTGYGCAHTTTWPVCIPR